MARIPPLNWLRAFEAAARFSSVSKGARELHVTPSAISQHIRRLEEALGAKLLWREGNKVRLSDEGLRLSRELQAAFGLIARAIEPFHGEVSQHLVVRAPSAFGAHWLVPRLAAFRAAHPAIDVVFQTPERSRRIDDEAADVEILYGGEQHGADGAAFLMRDWAFPACAPDYAAGFRQADAAGERPQLLCSLPAPFDTWRDWIDRFGAGPALAGQIVEMPRVEGAIEAAVHGIGVCLLPTSLAAEGLRSGRLVRPFEGSIRARNAYWMVRRAPASTPGMQTFLAWLNAEIEMFNETWKTN